MEWIERLEAESKTRLEELQKDLGARLGKIEESAVGPSVCIYATGSLARLEANAASDLDAFFLLDGNMEDTPLSRIRDVRILNAVIESSYDNKFPDFSNDGEYLKFLHIEDMIKHIGDREDDYHNMFTARMLLLLESVPLYNKELFDRMRKEILDRYFTDFHKHNDEFRPIFLLNDILRFWRTMCLNYENGRWWRTDDKQQNAKGHLANLKLRFSRLNICFSFICQIFSYGPTVGIDRVLEASSMTPLGRLRGLAGAGIDLESEISCLLEKYNWFLQKVSRPKDDVLAWISDKIQREEAFEHSDKFREAMYAVVQKIADKNGYMRYLVI